jgi:hypothetical protein
MEDGRMRFDVGPMDKQLRALGNTKCGFCFDKFREVEAVAAASTHSGSSKVIEESSHRRAIQWHAANLRKENHVQTEKLNQLNFEFIANKNLMDLFIIRLRRVYQD